MGVSSAFSACGRSSVRSATRPRASRRTRSIARTSLVAVPSAPPPLRRPPPSGPRVFPGLRAGLDVAAQAGEPHALDPPAAGLLHVLLVVVAVSLERELRQLDVVEHRPDPPGARRARELDLGHVPVVDRGRGREDLPVLGDDVVAPVEVQLRMRPLDDPLEVLGEDLRPLVPALLVHQAEVTRLELLDLLDLDDLR